MQPGSKQQLGTSRTDLRVSSDTAGPHAVRMLQGGFAKIHATLDHNWLDMDMPFAKDSIWKSKGSFSASDVSYSSAMLFNPNMVSGLLQILE